MGEMRDQRYRTTPEAYAAEVLRVRWSEKQAEVARSVRDNKKTLVKAAFGVGKTHVAAGLVNWWFDSYLDAKVATTAPTGRQVRDLLWTEIRQQRKTQPEADITQLTDPTRPNRFAKGFAAGKNTRTDEFGAQAAQGYHSAHLLFVMDEAAGVRPEIWETMGDIAVGAENRVLAIGNPIVTGGPFYDAVSSGRWNVITISALDHPNITEALAGRPEPYPGAVSLPWLEERLGNPRWCDRLGQPADDVEAEEWRNLGHFSFNGVWYKPGPIAEAKILGRFPTTLTDTVWAISWLEIARQRELKWGEADPLEAGLDVARFGDDNTVLHLRRGPCSLRHVAWGKYSNTATAGRTKAIIEEELASGRHETIPAIIIRVDTTGGHGAGPADILREQLANLPSVEVVDVNSSEDAIDKRQFPNRRSELWFSSAERGREGDLDLTALGQVEFETLQSQLLAPKFTYDSTGRKVVEKKAETKSRLGRSPDDADAFNLAYAGTRARALGDGAIGRKSRWAGAGTGREEESWTTAPSRGRWTVS